VDSFRNLGFHAILAKPEDITKGYDFDKQFIFDSATAALHEAFSSPEQPFDPSVLKGKNQEQ